MKTAVKIQNIVKNFGELQALNNISLEIEEAEIFGLIGADGAGKTTLFRILCTLLLPNSGSANIFGLDAVENYKEIRQIIGYMPGRFSLYQDLSVEENLNLFAKIFGTTIEENYKLVEPIYKQIEPFKKRKAGALSGGMKQKLALSCALIHYPKLLVLDEPTTGVDAVSRTEFWEMLFEMRDKGITILVSTPYMDEADRCDRVGLIQNGKILQVGTPNFIKESFNKNIYKIDTNKKYEIMQVLENYEFTHSILPFGEVLHYVDSRKENTQNEVSKFIKSKTKANFTIEPTKAGIEDCFIELMH